MKGRLGWLLLVGVLNSFCHSVNILQWHDQDVQEQYRFVVVQPDHQAGAYQCLIYGLSEMLACRFPNGPMRCNSVRASRWIEINIQQYHSLMQQATQLAVLCIDEGWLHEQQVNRCNRNLCGFALPWENGMAYVFDDLYEVENLSGLIASVELLSELGLLTDSEPDQLDDLDEIDRLIAGSDAQEAVDRSLPYPLDKVKQVLGQAFIATLLKYHDWKIKIKNYWRPVDGK